MGEGDRASGPAEGGNEATIRAVFDAWNRGDVEGALEHVDPEAELMPLRAQLEGTSYRGHEGGRRMYEDLQAEWERMQVEIEEYRDLGDRAALRCRLLGRGRASGIELDMPLGWLFELRDGKVLRSKTFSDPDDAFREAGVEP